MTVLTAILVVVSALVLGAHFLRTGAWPLVAVSLGMPFLLFVRRAWGPRLLAVLLFVAGFEWTRTAWGLAQSRRVAGEPWLRMALILGAVAAVAFLAAALVWRLRRPEKA
jgi:hypothetical protein